LADAGKKFGFYAENSLDWYEVVHIPAMFPLALIPASPKLARHSGNDLKYFVQTGQLRSFFVASDPRGMYKQVGTLPVLRPGNVPNQST
jgi:hypothetical protein